MNRREFLVGAAATVVALAASPGATARRLGGTLAALVTADTEAHVAAVELATGRILARLPTVEGPRSVESVNETLAVVCHTSAGTITIIDGARLETLRVIRGLHAPRYTAMHPFEPLAYVTDSGSGELLTLDLYRHRIVARTDLGGPARHLSISPDGRAVWVALGNRAARVAIVSTAHAHRPRPVAVVEPPYLAHDVVIAPSGRQAWVTSGSAHVVGVYDTARRELRHRLAADAPPQHIAFGPDRAYVASGESGTLRTYALRGTALLQQTAIPDGSYNITGTFAPHAVDRVFTPSLDNGLLTVLDTGGRIVRQRRVAPSAHDAASVVVTR